MLMVWVQCGAGVGVSVADDGDGMLFYESTSLLLCIILYNAYDGYYTLMLLLLWKLDTYCMSLSCTYTRINEGYYIENDKFYRK